MILRGRRGFAMITILWVMTIAGAMATAAALAGRNTVNATRNRVQLERAFWVAFGCAARLQAAIDDRLAEATSYEHAGDIWRGLDRAVLPLALLDPDQCSASLEAAGTRLDVNTASDEVIANLLNAIDYGGNAASLIDALADWRDSDSVARPFGAERDWYVAAQRHPPRDGPLADIRELARVRGFESLAPFDSLLTVDSGRISLATAPVTVLMSVPGFTRETAETIVAMRNAGTPLHDVISILGGLSRTSADALLARYADVVRLTTPNPDAWLLTVHAEVGLPRSIVTLTRRLVRSGRRAVVVQTRSER
jgi:type II secretory pathway component PulK